MITEINRDTIKVEAFGKPCGQYKIDDFDNMELLDERSLITAKLLRAEHRDQRRYYDLIEQINKILDKRIKDGNLEVKYSDYGRLETLKKKGDNT